MNHMRYGVISDSHDHFYNLDRAIEVLIKESIEAAFHLGDFCQADVILTLGKTDIQWYVVWGNVDGAKSKAFLKKPPNVDLPAESFRELNLDEGDVFLTHFPLLARHAAKSGEYRAVFYGHDHTAHSEMVNDTLLANPGEIAGLKTSRPSLGIWDSEDNSFEVIELSDFKLSR
jgi:putative phosphoesterase